MKDRLIGVAIAICFVVGISLAGSEGPLWGQVIGVIIFALIVPLVHTMERSE